MVEGLGGGAEKWWVGWGKAVKMQMPAWTLSCVTGTCDTEEDGHQQVLWSANSHHRETFVPCSGEMQLFSSTDFDMVLF